MINSNCFRKILVPLDGSKFSEKALQRACEMSKALDAKITLIYVIEKSPTLNILDRNEYLELLEKFGTRTLKKAKDIVLKKGIDAKTILKKGNIVTEIEKSVKAEKCDLIVVGNKGMGSITRLLLGSVSNKLAQSSSCSLLIVK
jgi:nucleotide-binding universal stress UspA family protein